MGIDPEPKFNKQFTTNEILETYHKYWKKDWKKNLAEIRIFNEPIRYIDLGKNNPVVFIHGLTSSSYIWRNIMPHLLDNVRCIAPDLMGMGFSGRNGDYSIKKQQKYFEEVIKQLLPINEKITLVLHEWGSILGLDWAKKNEERLKGIILIEPLVNTLKLSELSEDMQGIIKAAHSDLAREIILEKNILMTKYIPRATLRKLSEEELYTYNLPYAYSEESREALLQSLRQIPIGERHTETSDLVNSYSKWLSECNIPKLFIETNPGELLSERNKIYCYQLPNQTHVTVKGKLLAQEDSPFHIGIAIKEWHTEVIKNSKI